MFFILCDLDTDIEWVDLADDIKHEYFVIDNLRPSHGYKFRISARNKFGWSIPSIPSPIVMTPSSGASKAEFYDALQMMQVGERRRQLSCCKHSNGLERPLAFDLLFGSQHLRCVLMMMLYSLLVIPLSSISRLKHDTF